MKTNLVTKLVYRRKKTKLGFLKKIHTKLISLCGADIPETI